MVLYEIKSFDILIVFLGVMGSTQRKVKYTLGGTFCEAMSVKIITLHKPHVPQDSL
jgi:hypothetical protein